MTNDIRDLVEITRARFMAEQAKLRRIAEQEQAVRTEVAALEDQHKAAQEHYQSGSITQRSYGGDVLWQSYVGRSRRQFQMQLAQILVQKGQMISALQRAHGRKMAAEMLEADAGNARRQAQQKREIAQEESLLLMDLAKDQAGR